MATTNDTVVGTASGAFDSSDPGSYLNDGASVTGLELNGTMSVTTRDLMVNDESGSLQMLESTVDRLYGFPTLTPTYYIKVATDINASVTFQPGPQGCDANDDVTHLLGNDDAWGMSAITINDTYADSQSLSVTKLLPDINYTKNVATFTVNDPTGRSKDYNVQMNIVVNDQGDTPTASASLPDTEGFTGVVEDVYQLAQHAYWPGVDANPSLTSANSNDDDVLAATITSAQVDTYFTDVSSAMNDMESDITAGGAVLQSWSITINAHDNEPGNALSQYAQSHDINDTTLFAPNARIVAKTPALYTVQLTIEGGTDTGTHTMVNDNVYGILEQN
jgi:hypothetical protein